LGTVSKAVVLLELFADEAPEIGLSDLARLSGFNKATTRRLLVELGQHGLVEQNPSTRLYRLGAGILQLARVREESFPFLASATPFIAELCEATSETVHLSEYSARGLGSIHVAESPHANRVSVEVGMLLPLHATASGIAFLAFCHPRIRERHLSEERVSHTRHTATTSEALLEQIRLAKSRGYSAIDQGFEEGVYSVAAPVLDGHGFATGAVAVASPVARIDAKTAARHGCAVVDTAHRISRSLNGEYFKTGTREA